MSPACPASRAPPEGESDPSHGARCLRGVLSERGSRPWGLVTTVIPMGVAPPAEHTAVPGLSYALVTAARNEAENLGRLAASLERQTVLPGAWVIVENGSTDSTFEVAGSLAADHDWIRVISLPEAGGVARGGAIVRAFRAGTDALPGSFDVIVNLDADISMEPDYFERLLGAFAADERLGIASGSCWELDGGEWRQRFVTRSGAWGASRAYRRACLDAVSPLEERHGWDGIDELRAQVAGWSTQTLVDLPFRHHRPEGVRDGGKGAAWAAEGRLAHYMGYRFSYLLVRTLFRAVSHRDPAALAMVGAYLGAAARREPRCADRAAVGLSARLPANTSPALARARGIRKENCLAMCGICGVIQVRGEPRPVVAPGPTRPHDRRHDPSRPERRRHLSRRRRGDRRAAAQHRRRRRRPSAVPQRDGRIWAAQNGEIYNHDDAAARARRRAATASAAAATPRSSRTSTRSTARRSPSTCAACSRIAVWDGAAAPRRCSPATGSASSRSTTRSRTTCSSSPPS